MSFSADLDVPAISDRAYCSTERSHYLAAYHGIKYDSSMGTPSEDTFPPPVGTSVRGWIEFLSRGGLLVPSEDSLHKVLHCKIIFRDINGLDSLYKGKNISTLHILH